MADLMTAYITDQVKKSDATLQRSPGYKQDHVTQTITENTVNPFGEDGLNFQDLLDVVNPLQNIPVVNSLYRDATGDETSNGARLLGGTLYGGVFGLATAIADLMVKEATGQDMGETLVATFKDSVLEQDTAETADTEQSQQPSNLNLENLKEMQTELRNELAASGMLVRSPAPSLPPVAELPPVLTEQLQPVSGDTEASVLDQARQMLEQAAPPLALHQPQLEAAIAEQATANRRRNRNGHLSSASLNYLTQFAKTVQNHSASEGQQDPFRAAALDKIDYISPNRSGNLENRVAGSKAEQVYQALKHYETIQQKLNNNVASSNAVNALL